MMRLPTIISLALLFASAPALAEQVPAAKTLTLTDKFPTVGHATTIKTQGVVDDIALTYSPGSSLPSTETVAAHGMLLVLWRPQRAGVVSIAADGHGTKNISVRFDGVPMSGVVIMLLAAGILFGGAYVSLRALLAE